jgi:signal transduction histidine kinase/PAS domain-containing protein
MLKTQENDFADIADLIPVSVLIYEKSHGDVHIVYTNAYFRSLSYSSDSSLKELDQNGLLSLVHPDDRKSAEKFFYDLFQNLTPGETTYRSLTGSKSISVSDSGSVSESVSGSISVPAYNSGNNSYMPYRWYHLDASPVKKDDGSILAYVVFTDITDEKEAELRALKNELMYRLMSENSKQMIFEYNQEKKQIIYELESAYTRSVCEKLGMPQVINNVPESLVDMVDPPYRELFLSLFDTVTTAGSRKTVEYSSTIDDEIHWWRVNSMPVSDKDGRLLTVYCCAQDITDMKLEQQQYLDFFQTMDRSYPNNLGSFHLNITQNICIDGNSPYEFVMKQKNSGTVDGYFKEFSKLIADKETLEWFHHNFTRKSLLRRFRRGDTTVSFPYSIRYDDGLRWREAIIIMHQNPRTKDIEAVTYAIDTDAQKRGEMILKRMSGENSDFVGYIDTASETFVMHSGNWNCREIENGQRFPYKSCIDMLLPYCFSSEDKEQIQEKANLNLIKSVLKKENEHNILYSFREDDGSIHRKKLVFIWLDDNHSEILVIQSDITSIWTEEQERFHRLEETSNLRNIISNVSVGIMVFSLQKNKISLLTKNERVNELLGDGAKNGEAFCQHLSPRDAKKYKEGFHRAANAHYPVKAEFRYWMTPDSKPRWYRVIISETIQHDGSKLFYCCLLDVSDEKKSEEERILVQNKELQKYRTQLNIMATANSNFAASYHLNITQNLCTNMVIKNKSYASLEKLSMSGTVDGLFRATAGTIPDENIRSKVLSVFNCNALIKSFENGEVKVSIEYPCISALGGVRWILGSVNMIRNPETDDIEGITYATDIDDRKKNEFVTRHIAEQEFDYVGIMYLKTEELELVQKKDGINDLLIGKKYPVSVIRDIKINGFIDPKEQEAYNNVSNIEMIKDKLLNSGNYTFSYMKSGLGSHYVCRQVRLSWLDEPHKIALIVQTDITASYEHEEKQIASIQKAMIAAEEANAAKSDFVSRISHDIRTPLGAITNITDFAFEDINDPDKLKEDLRKIQVSNEFLLSLINDVLDISKIDSGKIELHPEPYPYDEYISNIKNMFEPLCEQKGIRLIIKNQRSKNATALIDKVRFNQITMNLLSNSVKYTPDGGSITYISKTEFLSDNMIKVNFTISDTGIGMSEEFQKKMFDPFTQEQDNPKKDKAIQGSGLGLSLVKKIVDLMGGEVYVESRIGQGTKITVSIVAPMACPDSTVRNDHNEGKALVSCLTGNILLAEDNVINTDIEKRILGALGLNVTHAENGKKVCELFENSTPGQYDLILMDIQMPVMNGYDATTYIRHLNRGDSGSIPIIAMSADAFSAAIEYSRSVGMTDYVTKPIDVKALRDVLKKYL